VNVEENESIESFEIIGLDERSKEVLLHNQNYSTQIQSLQEYKLQFFDDLHKCKDYLCKLSTNAKAILLVQEQWAETIVNAVYNLCPIRFIFIIHLTVTSINQQYNSSSEYSKVSAF